MNTLSRRRWTCPRCGTKWEIPAAAPDPRDCPECQKVDNLNAGRVVRVGNDTATRQSGRRWFWPISVCLSIGIALLACFAALQFWGGGVLSQAKKIAAQVGIAEAPYKQKVREWIKMNMSNPYPVEIHWWDARVMVDERNAQTASLEKWIRECREKIAKAEKVIDDLKKDGVQPPDGHIPGAVLGLDVNEQQTRWWNAEATLRDLRPALAEAEEHQESTKNKLPETLIGVRFREPSLHHDQFGRELLIQDLFLLIDEKGTCRFDPAAHSYGRSILETPGVTKFPSFGFDRIKEEADF